MINTRKLSKELKAAGIAHGGVNALGVVWGEDGITEIQNVKAVKNVIAAHDPTPPKKVDLAKVVEELQVRIAKLEK